MKRKLEIIFGVLLLIAGGIELYSMISLILVLVLMKSMVVVPFVFMRFVQVIIAFVIGIMLFAKAKKPTLIKITSVYFLLKGLFYVFFGFYLAKGNTNMMLSGETYVGQGIVILAMSLVSIFVAGFGIRSIWDKKLNPAFIAVPMLVLVVFRIVMQWGKLKPFDFGLFIAICIVGFCSQFRKKEEIK